MKCGWTYVSLHVVKTSIEISQHLRKVLATDQRAGPGRIQSASDWLQVLVILEILFDISSEHSDAFLLG